MSLQPQSPSDLAIPEETARAAKAAFPRGNRYLQLRDQLGTLFEDADFAALYSHRGRPTYSPWRLALATVMQYMENLSDRQAAEAVRARLDWKYALGLSLGDAGFDASVLCEFRGRLARAGAEDLLLSRVLERLEEAGLVKARGRQRTDSTRVLAAVRDLNRLELVGETLRAALNELASCAPDWLRALASSSWQERYGRRVEENRLPEGKKARMAYARLIGTDGFRLLDALDDREDLAERRTLEQVQVLRRVWSEQYERSAPGEVPRLRERRGRAQNSGRAESPYDPEARYRNRSGKRWTGYIVHLSESCDEGHPRIVTHVMTTTADVHEAQCTDRIHEALAEKGFAPGVHLADAAYIDARHLARATEQHGTRLIGPTRKDSSWQAKINKRQGMAIAHTKDRFQVDWEGKVAVCPEGKRSASWGEYADKSRGDYISARFAKSDCQACASKLLCTQGERRSLVLHPEKEHRALERMRELMRTEEGKRLYALRSGIEGTISQGVRAMGLRRTRYRGLRKTHFGHVATAAALNLARAGAWLGGRELAKTRTSRFLQLMS